MRNLLILVCSLFFTSTAYTAEQSPFVLDFSAKLSGNIPNPDLLNDGHKNIAELRFLNYSLTCEKEFDNCVLTVFGMKGDFCGENVSKPHIYENGYYFDSFEESNGLKVVAKSSNLIQI